MFSSFRPLLFAALALSLWASSSSAQTAAPKDPASKDTATPSPSLAETRRRDAIAYENFVFFPFVFTGEKFPPGQFEFEDRMKSSVGPYTTSTKFYNAKFEEVQDAKVPGRYGAITQVTLQNGESFKRYRTLFRQPKELDWYRDGTSFQVEFAPDAGLDAQVVREQNSVLSRYFRGLWSDAMFRQADSGALLAGLYETRAGEGNFERTDVWRRDAEWWYRLKRQTGDVGELKSLDYLPPGYNADPNKKWPLLLFLHGGGEWGSDLSKLTLHGPPRLIKEGKTFPFLVVAPQLPTDEQWLPLQLNDFLNHIETKYRVDTDRVYVTGLSRGGRGTWNLAMAYPERFAAIAPIAARGDATDVARVKNLPVWAFHGTDDKSMLFERGEAVVTALQKVGGAAKFTVYPGVGHDSWTQTYANPALYDWLLSHRRREKKLR